MNNTNSTRKLIPIMLAFFVMGFVDLVGIATNYVKQDFALSDTIANLFPSMVFVWFLVFSIPTSLLMNRIGRRMTVLISIGVTVVSLLLPLLNYSFVSMLLSFSLLGIGNTLMQVSLNPLISDMVSPKRLAGTLTFGQFVKAIASFLAPILAGWAALRFGDWKLLFPMYMSVAILAVLSLGLTSIHEHPQTEKASTFRQCLVLLRHPFILLAFLGIMCHVGLDVGINVTAPKLLVERMGVALTEAGIATSVYFLFRTFGCLAGSFLLSRVSAKIFFLVSVVMMGAGFAGLFFLDGVIPLYVCIGLIGLGNSNVFPIIFSQALFHLPSQTNEVSGLMIMGLFGGTVFPLLLGVASDAMHTQDGALMVLCVAIAYLLFFTTKISKPTNIDNN